MNPYILAYLIIGFILGLIFAVSTVRDKDDRDVDNYIEATLFMILLTFIWGVILCCFLALSPVWLINKLLDKINEIKDVK